MSNSLPRIARITFLVHLIVALLFGLWLLMAPAALAAFFGLGEAPKYVPLLRAAGAMMLGLGAVTSSAALFAKSWQQVVYLIYAEAFYLLLQAVVGMMSLILGPAPLLFNIVLLVVSVGLLALFIMTWLQRPR